MSTIFFSQELSPSKKMVVCQTVQSAVRTSISLLQKCQTKIKELVYSECGYKQDYSMSDTIVNLAALMDMHCKVTPRSTDYAESKDEIWYVLRYSYMHYFLVISGTLIWSRFGLVIPGLHI
jgi:hypothetical protein